MRRRLRAGFGDVAALDPAQLTRELEDAGVTSLVVHVDRQAQLHVREGGLATWTVTCDMSEDEVAAIVSEMKEHLPEFLKNAWSVACPRGRARYHGLNLTGASRRMGARGPARDGLVRGRARL